MKSVAVLALASSAAAQVSLYNSLAGAINSQIDKLDSVIKAYTGGDGSEVIASASGLITVVNSASSVGAKGDDISNLTEALSLLQPFVGVVNSVSTVINDLVSKKTLAFQNGLGPTAEAILKQESTAANNLAGLITKKLVGNAAAGKVIAQSSILDPLSNALNSGISAFSSGPAPTTGGSGGSASSSSSSSSRASSSSSSSASSSSSSSVASSTSTTTPTTTGGSGSGAGSGSTTSETSVPPNTSTSETSGQFTGNVANGLQVSGGLAFIVGALAYVL